MASVLSDEKKDISETTENIRVDSAIGGISTFNREHGYLEALCRGMRSGFLKAFEYRQLCQCENLEDVKLCLSDTDYCNVLANVGKLTPEIILRKCEDKFLQEFSFFQAQATGHLATFLDFLTYEDLIKNICLVIKSLIQGADPRTVLDRTSRFGKSPHLRSVLTFDNQSESGDGLLELYRTVLVDTPVAPYFEVYFNQEISMKAAAQSSEGGGGREISKVYNEVEIDIITNMIQKLWLEDFHRFTQVLGGETAELMGELLSFEADRRAISIVLNSFNTPLNDANNRDSERKKLFCSFGLLYPEATLFQFSKVSEQQQLISTLEPYRFYADIFRATTDGSKTIDDALYEHEVKLGRKAFDGQSHLASFYGWVKLKRQELRNLEWIIQCIHQKREAKDFNKWIKIV